MGIPEGVDTTFTGLKFPPTMQVHLVRQARAWAKRCAKDPARNSALVVSGPIKAA